MTRHRPADTRTPIGWLSAEPPGSAFSCSTRHYVQQLAAFHIDNRGAPPLSAPSALPPKQGLVHPHCFHRTVPASIGLQQRLTPTDDFVIDGMPITPQLHRHLRNGTTQSPDLNSCPPSSSGSQQSPLRSNRRVLLDERTPLTGAVWTHPAALSPPKPHRPAKHRKVHQPDRPVTLGPHRPGTALTHRPRRPAAYRHPKRPPPIIVYPYHINLAQTHQQLAHERRIRFHRGPPF